MHLIICPLKIIEKMNKIEKLTLVEGIFSNEEAKEILMNIFSTKIHFHEMKNFSSQERLGKPDETALKRIPALKISLGKLLKIVEEAGVSNKQLAITSEINISLQ